MDGDKIIWISTTIKWKYLNKIIGGQKKIEMKGNKEFWKRRLLKLRNTKEQIGINFLNGKDVYKFLVKKVYYQMAIVPIDIDGVKYERYFAIELGCRIEV